MKDLHKKCRLCLKIGSKMEHLFRNQSGDTYAEILYDVLKIEIEDNLAWPRMVCCECITLLLKIKKFRNQIFISGKKLLKDDNKHVKHLDEQCRLCLNMSFTSIPDLFRTNNGVNYPVLINYLFQIEITLSFSLPRHGCLDCIEFLQEAKQFHNYITTSHKTMYRIIVRGMLDATKKSNRLLKIYRAPVMKNAPEAIVEPDPTPDIHQTDSVIEESVLDDIIEDTSDMDVIDLESDLWTEGTSQEPTTVTEEGGTSKLPSPDNKTIDSDDSKLSETISVSTTKRRAPKPLTEKVKSVVLRNLNVRSLEELKLEELMLEMKLFVCRVCDLDTGTFYALLEHVRNAHDPKAYNICCQLTTKMSALRLYDHIRVHLDKDAFKCKECGKRFLSSASLRSHCQSFHSEEPAKHICEICGKSFWITNLYKSHLEEHKGIKYTCKYCGKESSTKQNNNLHIRLMHEKDNYTHLCEICGRGFPSQGLLSGHIADHGGPHGGNRRKKPKWPI